MKGLSLVLVLCALTLPAADKRRKTPKPPDIQIVETSARRTEGNIALDGRIRNSGEKPIHGLILLFDFMAPGHAVITTQKSPIDDEIIEPGIEAVFHVRLADPARAVEYKFNAVDQAGRELRVANAGPFAIE